MYVYDQMYTNVSIVLLSHGYISLDQLEELYKLKTIFKYNLFSYFETLANKFSNFLKIYPNIYLEMSFKYYNIICGTR